MIFRNPKKIRILEQEFEIKYINKNVEKSLVVFEGSVIKVYSKSRRDNLQVLAKFLRELGRKQIMTKVNFYAKKYSFEYNRISIKNQKTRWGSCSSKKNLNFNWKLILTTNDCLDYVVVHELCHLRQMNHSKKYWASVGEIMPDYKIHRATLRSFERELSKIRF